MTRHKMKRKSWKILSRIFQFKIAFQKGHFCGAKSYIHEQDFFEPSAQVQKAKAGDIILT